MAFGLLVVLLVLMFFAPRFTGMWAMGFAAGSLVALVISPIKGYPMLDIGFAVQAAGGWGLMGLATVVHERKQEHALRSDPVAMTQRRAMDDAVASVLGGMLVARGEAHALLSTTPEMVGAGRALFSSDGVLIFERDSGNSHKIEGRFIKSVEPVDHEDAPPGTLMIQFKPPILLFGISITPAEGDREKWLEIVPKESSAP
ncbi:hypothetical protein OG410_18690 [Streptomyces sp. NBC_00659]|uniref:hypothetical protein n=1 Tax=Streptomyces sp. NBC_00659 TaxID=2903669 RepID=UPI002E2FCD08|nr:hypothetical protein [Streptomyces sp. NBC_00659]